MRDWLDEIESQADETVPYYLPRMIKEIRRLQEQLAAASRVPPLERLKALQVAVMVAVSNPDLAWTQARSDLGKALGASFVEDPPSDPVDTRQDRLRAKAEQLAAASRVARPESDHRPRAERRSRCRCPLSGHYPECMFQYAPFNQASRVARPESEIRQRAARAGAAAALAVREPPWAPRDEPKSLEDMRRASTLVDEADGPLEYQQRLCALALIARQYLRELAASRVARGDASAEQEG